MCNGWISAKEKLPDALEDVLVLYKSGRIGIDWSDMTGEFLYGYLYGDPEYWMPLPEPPEGSEVHDHAPVESEVGAYV